MVSPTRIISLALTVTLVASAGQAQSPQLSSPPPGPAVFTPDQLDQLLAPIALHPDPLVGEILMAATYPLEVVQATRWLQDPNQAALTGAALTAALDLRPWDPSVKALVSFPEILRMMDGALEWTEAVGDAFLSDQVAVMDAIQRLRQRAQSAGTLVTTPQQMVLTQDEAIGIIPADPQVVYVPMYDPGAVYGTWVYTPSPYFGYPIGAPVAVVGGLSFGVGIVVVPYFWGWHHWDWHHHRLHVDHDRFRHISGHPPPPGGIWQHDPVHRHGIPYRDPRTRVRFVRPSDADVRGYGTGPPEGAGTHPKSGPTPTRAAAPPGSPVSPHVSPAPGGAGSAPIARPTTRRTLPPQVPPTHPATPPVGGALRPLAPAFESFGRGVDVRTQTERGQSSRRSIAPSVPQAPTKSPASGTHSGKVPSGSPKSGSSQPRR
jgi:hypothetical protein